MRTDFSQAYQDSSEKRLRLVTQIDFGGGNVAYFTSHKDIAGVPGAVLQGSLKNTSSISQKLNPVQGRNEIGAINFELIDKAAAVTNLFALNATNGRGLRGKTVRLFKGKKGLAFADFALTQTQEIQQKVSYDNGRYIVQCQDLQRTMRKDIFVPSKTRLGASVSATDTTIPCSIAAGTFGFVPHGPGFSDAAELGATLAAPVKVIYFRIKHENGFEICRALGKNSSGFLSVTRGLFGTEAVAHTLEGTPSDDNGPEIEEFLYLEGPAPKLAYAILTGRLLNQGGSDPTLYTLPDNMHLAIAENLVIKSEFENADGVANDWYEPADDARGALLRFEGISKTDGKAFIETQIMLFLAAYMRIDGMGRIGLRRMVRVLSDAAPVKWLTPATIKKAGDLEYDLGEVYNTFDILWSYLALGDKPDYFRRNRLVDQPSIDKWGAAGTKELKFQGLHAERHTWNAIKSAFDGLRDRHAGPPVRLKLELTPDAEDLEVGDIVRVQLPTVRDHLGNTITNLDRSFEVQMIQIDQDSGKISVDLFGSTMDAAAIADTDSSNAAELPNGWYSSQGQSLAAAGITVDGSGNLTADGTLNGATTMTATTAVFYYLGDLTIPSGRTLTINNNVQLRVLGHLQVNGTINCVGGGMAAGTSGYIGPTISGGAMRADWNPTIALYSYRGTTTNGKVASLPVFALENAGGVLRGFPADMRGTGSAAGGVIYDDASAAGGAGAKGGGALMTVSRGMGFGVNGRILLSGADGNPGGTVNFQNNPNWKLQAASSGGGAPGCWLCVLDGALATPPIPNGRAIAKYGALSYDGIVCGRERDFNPVGANVRTRDYSTVFNYHTLHEGVGGTDMSASCVRIQYVPQSLVPYPDYKLPDKAAAALAIAQAAQADADAAMLQLDEVASDGKLTAAEKKVEVLRFDGLSNEKAGIEAQATAYGITTEKTNYSNAYSALQSYLGGLSPAWNLVSATTTISRTVWKANWSDLYTKRQALLNKIAEIAGQRAEWGTVNGRPTTLYALDARSAAIIETRADGAIFSETFNDPNTLNQWEFYTGAGERSIVTDGEVTTGGKVLSIGNNAGDDMDWRMHKTLIPYRAGVLYRIRARVKRTVGGGTFYIGVAGIAADGVTAVNTTGLASWSSQHYIGAAGASPGTSFAEYIGYFKGWGSPNSGGASTWNNPTTLHANVRFIRPLYIANYSSQPGTTMIDYIKIEEVPVDSQGRPSELFNGALDATNDAAAIAAQAAASAAQTDASSSLAELADVAADGKLHKSEKKLAIREYNDLLNEQAGINARADGYGITTEKTTYGNAITALTTYLVGLSPAWNSTTSTTTITRTTWNQKWNDVYTARQALLNKIAQIAGERASWGNLSSRPGDFQLLNNWTENGTTLIKAPVGGAAYLGSGTQTGSLKITLPQTWTDTMLRFFVDVYNYESNKSFTLEVGGYTYGGSTVWINCYARIVGYDATHQIPVRFGHDGTKCAVYIGEATQAWNYASVRLRDFLAGYSNAEQFRWESGWVIGLVGSFGTITATITDTLPASDFPRSGRRWANYLWRNNGDSTLVSDIVQRINGVGRAFDTRLLRATNAWANTVTKSSYTTLTSNLFSSAARIQIAAFTAQYDYGSYSYPAGSITGLSFSTNYYVYMVDPNGDGTSVSYAATTSFTSISAHPDRAYIGSIITIDSGGGGGGGGQECVAVDMFIGENRYAGDVQPGDDLMVLADGGQTAGLYPCRANHQALADCVRIVTVSGCAVVCSVDTPVTLQDGNTLLAPNVRGRSVAVWDHGALRWEAVAAVEYAGRLLVAHISADDGTYAAGEHPDRLVFTHNVTDKP